ncbi:MAG: cupin domain-containing protein [Acidobacteriaceae bacterium]|nr:cupin domain-containing protein [Acidobacteriaceae bacterium]
MAMTITLHAQAPQKSGETAATNSVAVKPKIKLDSDDRAEQIIEALDMKVLVGESGYLGIYGRTPLEITLNHRSLAVQNQVYYLLTRDRPMNYLHWLEPADTQVLIEGGPVDYYIFHPDGSVEMRTLGMNFGSGQEPMVAVPPGCWKALVLHPEARYALMANVLSPEFTTDRVRIGAGQDWIARYAGKASWATPERLREFIGPNWR